MAQHLQQINAVGVDTPSIFMPLALRGSFKYRGLGRHVFSVAEKTWLCNFIIGNRALHDRAAIVVALCERYSIDHHTVEEWVSLYSRGAEMAPGSAGVVPVLDGRGMRLMQQFMRAGPREDESDTDHQSRFIDFMKGEMENSIHRRAR